MYVLVYYANFNNILKYIKYAKYVIASIFLTQAVLSVIIHLNINRVINLLMIYIYFEKLLNNRIMVKFNVNCAEKLNIT